MKVESHIKQLAGLVVPLLECLDALNKAAAVLAEYVEATTHEQRAVNRNLYPSLEDTVRELNASVGRHAESLNTTLQQL